MAGIVNEMWNQQVRTPKQSGRGTVYSQSTAVRAITSYYQFLERFYFPPGVLLHPPPSGWTQITTESLEPFNKNEDVINLLRRIPYLDQSGGGDKYNIMRKTWPIMYIGDLEQSYMGDDMDRSGWHLEPMIFKEKLPPHAVCLANGTKDSYFIIIDTERGVVVCDEVANTGQSRLSKLYGTGLEVTTVDGDGKQWWMACPTFGIEQFFDILKQKWLRLEWMPHSNGGKDVWETDEDPDKNDLAMRKIMLDCGWPGDGKGGKWKRQKAEELIDSLYDKMNDTD